MNSKFEPDLEWCKHLLSSLDPSHKFFKKEYLPTDEELGIKNKKALKPINSKLAELISGLPP